MKLPNFLIVGAAKAGTTSLYYYLKEHPDIYMSPVKEPKFITSNFLKFPFRGIGDSEIEEKIVKNWKDYIKLFSEAAREKAIGEASADNLYFYDKAIYYIKKYLGDVKIIIILRNPVDRAFSAYTHLVRDGREYLSFEEAIRQEKVRKKENWEFIWYYVDVGFYYKQVKSYIDNFSDVKVYLYDDLKKDPLSLVQDIYSFLEVDDTFVPNIIDRKFNVSGIPRSKFIHEFILGSSSFKSGLKRLLKLFVSDDTLERMRDSVLQFNLKKPRMKEETRLYLLHLYKEDILKLQDLIKRDLSNWLK